MPRGIPNRLNAEAQTDQPLVAPVSARAEETRRERRRRDDGDLDRSARLKLAIPKEIQERAEREGKTLRWIKDDPGRLLQAQADDWDRVDGIEPVSASRAEESKLVLHAKYKDWYDSDQTDKARLLDEREKAVAKGAKAHSEDSLPDDVRYAAKGNRISRGA
jgi:hypothetical protein